MKELTEEMQAAFVKQMDIVQWSMVLLHLWRQTGQPVVVDKELFDILEEALGELKVIDKEECDHQFSFTGQTPCTGPYKCMKCGKEGDFWGDGARRHEDTTPREVDFNDEE